MHSTLQKSFSVSLSSKAHVVLDWTIENARLLRQRTEILTSDPLPFKVLGFETSTRWDLSVNPDAIIDKKRGDPKCVGIFLGLKAEDACEKHANVQAICTIQIFIPKTNCWETVAGPDKSEHNPLGHDSWAFGRHRAVSHTSLCEANSRYLSDDGALTIRGIVDFEMASSLSQYVTALSTRLADSYKSAEFSDFELVSGDKVAFPVHRFILAAHSSVFRAMFMHGTKESKESRAVIEDINGETLNIMLKFMYSGDIAEVKDTAENVLKAADKYNIPDLRDLAVKYLCESQISLESAYRLLTMADQRSLPALHKAVSGFIVKNWDSLHRTPEFLQLKATNSLMFGIVETACSYKKRKLESA